MNYASVLDSVMKPAVQIIINHLRALALADYFGQNKEMRLIQYFLHNQSQNDGEDRFSLIYCPNFSSLF